MVLVLVTVLGLRLLTPSRVQNLVPASATSSTIPAFTSATVYDGDALKGLGPEWTFLRQTDLSEKSATSFAGTAPRRESVVKLVGKQVQLVLTELNVIDPKALRASITSQALTGTTIAGREGYVVSVPGLTGGTGFVLIGSTTALLFQDANVAQWPSELDPAVMSYIAAVRVP